MAGSMNRIHDMPPGVIEDLDERYPVGVLGQDAGGWGYITMGPDRNPETVLNDGWGLLLPNYYYYMPPAFTTHATTHPPSHTAGSTATAAGTVATPSPVVE